MNLTISRELQLNFKGCLFDFFRAEHNGWSGFCQDFWGTNQECLRRSKTFGFSRK